MFSCPGISAQPQRELQIEQPETRSPANQTREAGAAQGTTLGLNRPVFVGLATLVIVVLFLLFDLSSPAHLAIPISYLATLVLVMALPGRREKIFVASGCSLLLSIDFYLTSRAPSMAGWVHLLDHVIALIMIWSVTTLGLRHLRLGETMKNAERSANEQLAQINIIYASAPVGLCFVDRELRYLSVNDAMAEMMGRPPEFFINKTLREAAPELANIVEAHYRQVIDAQQPVTDIEVPGVNLARPKQRRYWLSSYFPVHDGSGALLGVNVAVRDITNRKQAEADTLFLLDLGECIRCAADPGELTWSIAVALGEHLAVKRCCFAELDPGHDQILIRRDYHPHAESVAGKYPLKEISAPIANGMASGETLSVADVAADRRTAAFVELCRQVGVAACVASPLRRDGRAVAVLFVATAEAYQWSEREIALVNIVAERTWLAVEKLRLDLALRESDAALRDADQRKDEFLATLAHEFRNPLSLIRNVVTLQKTPGSVQHDKGWGQDIIDRQVSYLTRLTDDLFDVSRITREKLVLQKEPANLSEIINAAIESSRPLIEERRHQLTVNLSVAPIYVDADRVRLTQVFMNLLNNAAKYSPDPGNIWLNVASQGDAVVVSVKDTGLGIAAESLPHLFELFYQVDRSFTRAEGGLGLGLTLVHRLVELHGGTVEVRSAGLKQGSEFIVRLPTLATYDAMRDTQASINAAESAVASSRRILVADDFPESANTLARLLRQEGNQVEVAHDGLEALEVAERFCPDVILMDIAMPKLNGYEAAQKIREQAWGQKILLVALTGWGQQQDRQRTRAAGFDAHLTKPINFTAIKELLDKMTGATEPGAGAEPVR